MQFWAVLYQGNCINNGWIYMGQKKRKPADRQQNRKHPSIFRQHKRSVAVICTVLGLLAAALAVNSVSLYGRNQVYKQQEAELRAQIEEQNARTEEVKEYAEYVKSEDYIRDVAQEKLGLVDPKEILFQPEE